MSLDKTNFNVRLGSDNRKKHNENARHLRSSRTAIEERFAKRTTIIGQEDGLEVAGIKTLGQSTNSSEEVITSSVGQFTDNVEGLSGPVGNSTIVQHDTVLDSDGNFLRWKMPTDSDGSLTEITQTIDSDGSGNLTITQSAGRDANDPARSFGSMTTTVTSLTGLPALKANNPTSALAVVCDGTAESIVKCQGVAENKKAADFTEIESFTDTIEAMKPPKSVSGGFGGIGALMSTLTFASNMATTLSAIAPIASINSAVSTVTNAIDQVQALPGKLIQKATDLVVNATGIDGLIDKAKGLKPDIPELGNTAGAVVDTDLDNVSGALDKFKEAADNFNVNYDGTINKGLPGVLQNVAEAITGAASSFIANIVPGGISATEQERRKILKQFTLGDEKDKKEGVKTLVTKSPNVSNDMKQVIADDPNTSSTLQMQIEMIEEARKRGVPEDEIARAQQEMSLIADKMNQLDATISGSVVVTADLFDIAEPIDQSAKWSGRNSPDDMFTMVSSVEELDAEFQNIFRDITEVVIHATETYTNKDLGAVEINNLQIELGHEGIGYHYVIRRDGRLQRGRPVNRIGEHASTNGHDTYSIGIAMVGGLNVSSGENNATDYRSSQSFTREQFTTLEKFVNSFYRRYPGGQVFGHNDIDAQEFDPYFDVQDYVESVFRKKNTTLEPLNRGPLSPAEIIE
jgi:N-acetylmuramoyl-L-alanine amidase